MCSTQRSRSARRVVSAGLSAAAGEAAGAWLQTGCAQKASRSKARVLIFMTAPSESGNVRQYQYRHKNMFLLAEGRISDQWSRLKGFLWRGSLLPLGCEATPALYPKSRACCAVQREQAPSPQVCV